MNISKIRSNLMAHTKILDIEIKMPTGEHKNRVKKKPSKKPSSYSLH